MNTFEIVNMAEFGNSKLRSNDRKFVLEEIPNYKPLKSIGMLDPQVFKGGNALHAMWSDADQLWYLKYEKGGAVPGELNQKFTKFSILKDFVESYFNKRGFKIKEVIE